MRWLVAAALAVAAIPSQAQDTLEASVKAAYLYKFLAYVDWPPSTFPGGDAPHVIGVMGADAVHAELRQLVASRPAQGRPLVVRRLAAGDPLEGLHVLYVGRGARAAQVAPTLAGRPVLMVTDAPGGLADGGALNFLIVEGRVRFEAAPAAAERGGLKLSARLLAVAERVHQP